MQDELGDADVVVHGVNETGFDSANADMCEGRDLPWLQEGPTDGVWTSWNVTYRDVIILDRDNVFVTAFNLTDQDLGVTANYEALRGLLEEAAAR